MKNKKNSLFEMMEKINPDFKIPLNEESPDVSAMKDILNDKPNVKYRFSKIDNAHEFKGAFKAWFELLGFQPDDITLSRIKADIDDVLTKKGF